MQTEASVLEGIDMACKITHRSLGDQQIRFANREAAERYAEIMGGGVQNWVFTTVPSVVAAYGWGPYPERAPRRRIDQGRLLEQVG